APPVADRAETPRPASATVRYGPTLRTLQRADSGEGRAGRGLPPPDRPPRVREGLHLPRRRDVQPQGTAERPGLAHDRRGVQRPCSLPRGAISDRLHRAGTAQAVLACPGRRDIPEGIGTGAKFEKAPGQTPRGFPLRLQL